VLAIPVEELVLYYVSLCTQENSAVQECLLLLLFHRRVRLQEFPVSRGSEQLSFRTFRYERIRMCLGIFYSQTTQLYQYHTVLQFSKVLSERGERKTFMNPQIDI